MEAGSTQPDVILATGASRGGGITTWAGSCFDCGSVPHNLFLYGVQILALDLILMCKPF